MADLRGAGVGKKRCFGLAVPRHRRNSPIGPGRGFTPGGSFEYRCCLATYSATPTARTMSMTTTMLGGWRWPPAGLQRRNPWPDRACVRTGGAVSDVGGWDGQQETKNRCFGLGNWPGERWGCGAHKCARPQGSWPARVCMLAPLLGFCDINTSDSPGLGAGIAAS